LTRSDLAQPLGRRGRPRLERLWDPAAAAPTTSARSRPDLRGGRLLPGLRDRYDGHLGVALRRDRPTVIANFVSTLDGVVAFDVDGSSGGGEVSGFSDPDRFVMGLLRAMADVVLVGAGTVRAAPTHEWTPRRVHPGSTALYATWRHRMGIVSPQPTTIVATASGSLDPEHPGLSAADVPVILATTEAGAERLRAAGPAPNVRIEIAGTGGLIAATTLVEIAAASGARLVLCEGGPHLIGDLLAAGLLDELFLTLAPQLAGRDDATRRLALVEGAAFGIARAPWAELGSVRRSGDHLFLRYRIDGRAQHRDGQLDEPRERSNGRDRHDPVPARRRRPE
jgi:riboflavin biosynthesis pyrimidine reductase